MEQHLKLYRNHTLAWAINAGKSEAEAKKIGRAGVGCRVGGEAMTLEEAKEIAKGVLSEGEHKNLKIVGPGKPYSDKTKKSEVMFEKPLAAIEAPELREACSTILMELSALDGFCMSEPNPHLKAVGYGAHPVSRGNLCLYFVIKTDSRTLETVTHVRCWYHLAGIRG